MSTRARAAYLRSQGFEKAEWALTRVGYTYEHSETGVRVTVLKGAGEGANFTIQRGCVDFPSGFLFVGNLGAGAKAMLQHLFDSGLEVPDPSRDDFLQPQYMEELFRGLVHINLNYEKAA
jgi:hypothetical protein